MKLLIDTCISSQVVRALGDAGHDVVWSGDWHPDPGDAQILAVASREGRVLVTLDKDFGDLAVAKGQPHAGIIRLVGFKVSDQAATLGLLLAHYQDELSRRAILTVDRSRVRIRLPDVD